MSSIEHIKAEVLSYLLTLYPVDSEPCYLDDVVREYLVQKYTAEFVDRFVTEHGERLRQEVVAETNDRMQTNASLRYTILDDIGLQIRGAAYRAHPSSRLLFQDALQILDPSDFENLSGFILRMAGCHAVWLTPLSHDQGLDAFGYSRLFRQMAQWEMTCAHIVYLAQAKHYLKNPIRSYDLREFIGAITCAKHQAYALHKDPYPDLKITPFAPLALVYLTSGELTVSAKTLARNSGIIILGSDDLYEIISSHLRGESQKNGPKTKRQYVSRLRKLSIGIERARRIKDA